MMNKMRCLREVVAQWYENDADLYCPWITEFDEYVNMEKDNENGLNDGVW